LYCLSVERGTSKYTLDQCRLRQSFSPLLWQVSTSERKISSSCRLQYQQLSTDASINAVCLFYMSVKYVRDVDKYQLTIIDDSVRNNICSNPTYVGRIVVHILIPFCFCEWLPTHYRTRTYIHIHIHIKHDCTVIKREKTIKR